MRIEKNIKDINVGDLVFVGEIVLMKEDLAYASIHRVEKITPTGQFRLKDYNTKFNNLGKEIVSDSSARYNICRSYAYIYKATEELIEIRAQQIKEIKTIREAKALFNDTKITYEQAKQIIEILS